MNGLFLYLWARVKACGRLAVKHAGKHPGEGLPIFLIALAYTLSSLGYVWQIKDQKVIFNSLNTGRQSLLAPHQNPQMIILEVL